MKIKRTMREAGKLLAYNFGSIVVFEIIFKIFASAFMVPIMYGVFNISVKCSGIKYLTAGNFTKYMRAPSTYFFIFLLLLIVAAYVIINVSGLIYAMDYSRRGKKISPFLLLIAALRNTIRLINPRNFGMILMAMFVIPYSYTILISGSLTGIKLPEFFRKVMLNNKLFIVIIVALYVLCCLISISRLYSINYFTIYHASFTKATRLSRKDHNNNKLKLFIGITIINAVLTLLLLALETLFATTFAGVISKIVDYKTAVFLFNNVLHIVFLILYMFFSTISTPVIYSFICACFYEIDEITDYTEFEEVRKRRIKKEKHIKDYSKKAMILVLCLSLVANVAYLILLKTNRVSLDLEYPTHSLVTAHRGDSMHAPENTMAAFQLALDNQADIIETDIRQTKDGEFILMHDKSLLRTTGVNKNVGDVTFDYIKTLDAGSWFSDEYKGEQIPTLEEVLQFAVSNDVKLNLELKPESTDNNYVEGILELLEEYDYLDECIIASSDYDSLKKVKEYNPDIFTVRIMSVAFGELGEMEYVDGFSIKHAFISKSMVESIHKNKKVIYAWTINNESDIKDILLLDVDSVITDKPYEAKNIIYNANNGLFMDYLERLIKQY